MNHNYVSFELMYLFMSEGNIEIINMISEEGKGNLLIDFHLKSV